MATTVRRMEATTFCEICDLLPDDQNPIPPRGIYGVAPQDGRTDEQTVCPEHLSEMVDVLERHQTRRVQRMAEQPPAGA